MVLKSKQLTKIKTKLRQYLFSHNFQMKTTITLFTLLIAFISSGQGYSSFIGKKYSDKSEITALDTLINIDSRVDLDRKICRHFADSSWTKHFIILEQEELINDTLFVFTILDIIEINDFPKNGIIVIGSNEFKNKNKPYGFVISVECCYDLDDVKWADKSKQILKAWTNENRGQKLIEVNPKTIIRINEGFYKKETAPNKK